MKVAVSFVLAFIFVVAPAYSHEVTVGVKSLGDEYERPDYIISGSNGIIAGVVSRGLSEATAVQGGYTELTQDSAGNKFYVVLTRGTRDDFVSRMRFVQDGTFEKFYSPSFGFDLNEKKRVFIEALYSNIDIVGDELLRAGSYNLVIRYDRVSGGRPQISIKTSS